VNVVELADVFPNGLHDAEAESIRIDDANRTASVTVYVWIGSLEDPGEERESYRRGTLEFRGVHYCARELPFAPPAAPFTCRFWVNEWNGFVHLAAQEARFTWADSQTHESWGAE